MDFLSASILALIEEIKMIQGTSVVFRNEKREIEIHAPDLWEVEENEEQKALKLMEKLEKELRNNGFKIEVHKREGEIDAIRIDLTCEKISIRCPACGGNIKKVVCRKHDEEFEIGHTENCPNRNVSVLVGDDCAIERVD